VHPAFAVRVGQQSSTTGTCQSRITEQQPSGRFRGALGRGACPESGSTFQVGAFEPSDFTRRVNSSGAVCRADGRLEKSRRDLQVGSGCRPRHPRMGQMMAPPTGTVFFLRWPSWRAFTVTRAEVIEALRSIHRRGGSERSRHSGDVPVRHPPLPALARREQRRVARGLRGSRPSGFSPTLWSWRGAWRTRTRPHWSKPTLDALGYQRHRRQLEHLRRILGRP
jgi:hypothetical protein